jgi:hypothetical protein
MTNVSAAMDPENRTDRARFDRIDRAASAHDAEHARSVAHQSLLIEIVAPGRIVNDHR